VASRPGTVKIVDTKIQREVPWDAEAGAIRRGRADARADRNAGVTAPRAGRPADRDCQDTGYKDRVNERLDPMDQRLESQQQRLERYLEGEDA